MQSVRYCRASQCWLLHSLAAFVKGFFLFIVWLNSLTQNKNTNMAYQHRESLSNQQRYNYRDPEAEVSEQLSRHHDLERGLDRMQEVHERGPTLAHVVMEECREAKIRKQNKQILISVGVTIGLIVAVIWFVVSR